MARDRLPPQPRLVRCSQRTMNYMAGALRILQKAQSAVAASAAAPQPPLVSAPAPSPAPRDPRAGALPAVAHAASRGRQ
eukprot:4413579-Prorocentrum_lima.AAC.1